VTEALIRSSRRLCVGTEGVQVGLGGVEVGALLLDAGGNDLGLDAA
jgi:hypothetical protein